MGPWETADCAIIGFTIRGGQKDFGAGISGGYGPNQTEGTHAQIMHNVFVNNVATGGGGALAFCHGLIQYNTIGASGAPNRALHGAGLYACNGTVRRNLIRYNEADALGFGAGLAQCSGEVTQNYIARNKATTTVGYGGGLAWCYGTVRSNIVYYNEAATEGAGLYDCDATVIEQNTVYDNRIAAGGHVAGMYNCGPNTTVRNNILWENKSGGSTTNAQIGGTFFTLPIYCCIQEDTNPNSNPGNGNIGPFSQPPFSPGFLSTSPTSPWEQFLHLSSNSDCIDKGYTDFDHFPDKPKKYRDFDHQSGPFDGPTDDDGEEGEAGEIAQRDIGADEYPTGLPGDFTYWWEQFGTSPGP
ncbi:MAG: right-handed parallel beta-helix repeat-containing protein [Candidatus Hydrogenedentes bacterium]|nr:right-handed parallel beta-helix repeat-containing protein [Candidatus Hydrogenedentota bacterium]